MELTSPLPWQANRAPSDYQMEVEAEGFMDLLNKQGGGA